jgi:hypothetical protein
MELNKNNTIILSGAGLVFLIALGFVGYRKHSQHKKFAELDHRARYPSVEPRSNVVMLDKVSLESNGGELYNADSPNVADGESSESKYSFKSTQGGRPTKRKGKGKVKNSKKRSNKK